MADRLRASINLNSRLGDWQYEMLYALKRGIEPRTFDEPWQYPRTATEELRIAKDHFARAFTADKIRIAHALGGPEPGKSAGWGALIGAGFCDGLELITDNLYALGGLITAGVRFFRQTGFDETRQYFADATRAMHTLERAPTASDERIAAIRDLHRALSKLAVKIEENEGSLGRLRIQTADFKKAIQKLDGHQSLSGEELARTADDLKRIFTVLNRATEGEELGVSLGTAGMMSVQDGLLGPDQKKDASLIVFQLRIFAG